MTDCPLSLTLDMGREGRSKFRPCIDLHNGQVKQIVGGTLSDGEPNKLKTNFVARWVSFDLASANRPHVS